MQIARTAALAALLTTTSLPAWSADDYVVRFPATVPERKEILTQQRDPATAAVIGAIVPGVGHIYAGNWQRGGIVSAVGLGLVVGGLLFMNAMTAPGQDPSGFAPVVTLGSWALFDLWNARDAYYTSVEINHSLEEQARGTALPKGASF